MSQQEYKKTHSAGGSLFLRFFRENGALLFSLLMFGTMLYLLLGTLFDHTIYQSYPYVYFAGDQSAYLAITNGLLDRGDFLFQPDYVSFGLKGAIPHNGPGVAHLPALVTKLLGIETFNAVPLSFGIIFLLLPFVFLSGLQLRPEIKFLSLSFLPLLLTFNFIIGYLWGQYGSILGAFFLFVFFLIFNETKFRKPIFIGIILTAMAFSHFPELVFAMIFLAISLLWDFLNSKTPPTPAGIFGFAKKYAWLIHGFLIFIVLSSFFLVLFYYGNIKTLAGDLDAYRFTSVTPSEFTLIRTVPFETFREEFRLLILAGVAILLLSTKGIGAGPKLTLFSVVLLSNFNYIGVIPSAAYRAFQFRYHWPFMLAPFAAMAIVFVVSAIGRRISLLHRHRWLIYVLLFAVLFSASFKEYHPVQGPGVITKDQFDAMRFLEKYDTSKGDILFLYGDGYDQISMIMKKRHYRVSLEQMIKSMKERITYGNLEMIQPALPLDFTKAFFNGTKLSSYLHPQQNRTICEFRFYLFDRFSHYNNPLVGYNQLFVDNIDQSKFSVAYTNPRVVVFENKGGKECLRSENK